MINKTTDNTYKLMLISILFLPFIINPIISESFDVIYLYPKIWWIYGVLLPSMLLSIWQNRTRLQLNVATILLGGMAGWLSVIGVFVSPTFLTWLGPADRLDGIVMHLVYLLSAATGLAWINDGRPDEKIAPFSQAAILGASALALTNVLQQLGILGIPGEGAFMGISATLFGGTLGNRGYMGGALALLLPLALSLLVRQQRVIWHWAAVVLITWALAGSYARGAWLAGAAGLVWLLICQPQLRRLRFWWPVLLGLTLIYPAQMIGGKGGRAFQSAEAVADSSGRDVLWKSALSGISEKPLTGWGAPALWKAMNARPDAVLLKEYGVKDIQSFRRLSSISGAAEVPSFLIFHTQGKPERITMSINKVHNEYLDYALTYGIPAALLFTILLAWAIWSGRTFAPGVSAGVLAYAVYLFTWPEIIRFAPIAWFMMGICLAFGRKNSPLCYQRPVPELPPTNAHAQVRAV